MDFKKLILFLLICVDLSAYSQQNNNWYFGAQAGLNFNGAVPSTLSNGAMNAPEGCSSISDKSGNLLFYTNGVTVYNRNHQTMLKPPNIRKLAESVCILLTGKVQIQEE